MENILEKISKKSYKIICFIEMILVTLILINLII